MMFPLYIILYRFHSRLLVYLANLCPYTNWFFICNIKQMVVNFRGPRKWMLILNKIINECLIVFWCDSDHLHSWLLVCNAMSSKGKRWNRIFFFCNVAKQCINMWNILAGNVSPKHWHTFVKLVKIDMPFGNHVNTNVSQINLYIVVIW